MTIFQRKNHENTNSPYSHQKHIFYYLKITKSYSHFLPQIPSNDNINQKTCQPKIVNKKSVIIITPIYIFQFQL